MKYIPVVSSTIKEIGYDNEKKLLHVKFNNGIIYQYNGITEPEYRGLMTSRSKGSHLAKLTKKGVKIETK